MMRIEGLPVLSAAQMRAAEDEAVAAGGSVAALMARAGAAVAEQVRRLAGRADVLVLCGPGNNGGDGFIAATALAAAGLDVRVATSGEARGGEARGGAAGEARRGWPGAVESLAAARPATVLVDALFGTGLNRGLDGDAASALLRLGGAAALTIAIDLPSGVDADDGRCLSAGPRCDLTLALGAVKPAHVLQPAAARCGTVRVIDIGVAVDSAVAVLARPALAMPDAGAHKYTRGMVVVIAGAMPGAAALAAGAAARGGAGYVLMLGGATDRLPHAIVRRRLDADALDDPRIGAVLIGPGLGRDDRAGARLAQARGAAAALVIDGDALRLLDPDARRAGPTILTPHEGEFAALFGEDGGGKIARAQAAAARSGAVVVLKGADTVIAAPDGRARVSTGASTWLSTAGTGDVLAGLVAARMAVGGDPFAAACEAVWLHGEAARRAGPAFVADDLAGHVPGAIAACL